MFKKIDSTLRGAVAAEVAALAAALPGARILFTPANPAVGRTVRDGVLLVRGVPVAETEFARDPVSPVRESSIPRLLAGVAQGRLTIADAATDGDLAAAVARIAAGPGEWVAVGSAALARAVAAHFADAGGKLVRHARDVPAIAARHVESAAAHERVPVLYVCGSAHPLNRAQAERLARRGVAVHEIVPGGDGRVVAAATADVRARGAAALRLPARTGGAAHASEAALAAIVAATGAILAATDVRRLMVTGGETAFALCTALGIRTLRVRDEIEPGLVLADAPAADGGRWWFAIKPGGFGSETTWERAGERLRRED